MAKLKGSGDKASPCFRQFWIGKLLDKCLPIWTLLYVSFKHILISLTNFMGTQNSMIILYNTSLLSESYVFLQIQNQPETKNKMFILLLSNFYANLFNMVLLQLTKIASHATSYIIFKCSPFTSQGKVVRPVFTM
jgi:hypothetical protein